MRSGYHDKQHYKQYLYKLTFPNEMVYIGVAFDVKDRWASAGAHYRGQQVYKYIKEYGWENIKKEILLYLPHSEEKWIRNTDTLHKLERELIHAYGDRCYNQQASQKFHNDIAQRSREKGVYDPKVLWTINGITKAATLWCKERGVTYTRMKRILDRYNITPEQALTLPPVPSNMAGKAVEYWEGLGFDYFENCCRA